MLGLFFLLRKRTGFFEIVAKDASKPTVSWLKFEPRVSNFPNISSHSVAPNVIATIKNPILFFRDRIGVRMRWDFLDSSKGRQQTCGFMAKIRA